MLQITCRNSRNITLILLIESQGVKHCFCSHLFSVGLLWTGPCCLLLTPLFVRNTASMWSCSCCSWIEISELITVFVPPVSHECQCLFLCSQLSDSAEISLRERPGQHFSGAGNDVQNKKRKDWIGERWIRRHLPSWLVRFGWLAGVWHRRALFGGALEESAECWWMWCKATWLWTGDLSLTPVFVPSTHVFSKALALAAPHRTSPPLGLMWSHTSAARVPELCCWGYSTRDKISPQHPHNKRGCVWMHAASSVSAAGCHHTHTPLPSCNPVVCVCVLTCACAAQESMCVWFLRL